MNTFVSKILFFFLLSAGSVVGQVYVPIQFNRIYQFYGGLQVKEISAPSTPPANFGHVYEKSDGRLYFKNDGGTEYLLTPGGGAGTVTSFTFTDGSGFDGTVTNSTTTPTLALTTTITDNYVLFSNSGALGGSADLQWDGSKLSIAGVDAMTVNGTPLTTLLQVHGQGGVSSTEVELHRHSNTAGAGVSLYGARSRGTEASPTVVSADDVVTNFTGVAYDGTDYATSAQIQFEVDATPGSNDMPGRIVFNVSPDGSQTLTEKLRISSTGLISIANTVSSYNGITTANNGLSASVGTPVHLTGQTAAIAATTAYTADADGFYQVCYNAAVTTAATVSSVLGPIQVKYTNQADNVVKTFPTSAVNFITQTNANTTGSALGGVFTVYAKTGTTIQYVMGYTSSGATAMAYSLDITILKL